MRMHAANPLEDMLGVHAGRSHQLRDAMLAIAAEGRGVVVLLRDMSMKLDVGDHVSPNKLRQYGVGAQILNALGLQDLRAAQQLAEPQGGRTRRLRSDHRRHPADCAGGRLRWRAGTDTDALPPPRFTRPTRVLVVVAPFYREIADGLIAGARAALASAGVDHDLVEVPGALEIPTAIALAARSGEFDGYVALGCVIRGETTHYDTVCNDSSRGLTLLGLRGLAIGNGILTVENRAQAEVRADPEGADKGGGAAAACLHLIALARRFAPAPKPLHEGSVRVAVAPDSGIA